MSQGIALFDTAIGTCGLAWGPAGIRAAQLPGASDPATRARLARHVPGAVEQVPPAEIALVIGEIQGLMRGEKNDLLSARLDLSGVPPFHLQVYALARNIPPGRTMTYGEVAARLGDPGAARAVGQALGQNPIPIIVPCHRVMAAGGNLGGFSAPGGATTKQRLLVIEGAIPPPQPTLFDL